MKVNWLDHVNIFTDDMATSAKFYSELLDLDVRNGPAPMRPEQVQWVYDDQNRPIIHLNARGAPQAFRRDCPPGLTGPIHHVALNCSGKDEVARRLEARGAEFARQEIASIGLTQIFTHDPNGVLLELNFYGD
ncbi:MAG TPA: VOC family protein [Caulobacteraceae bacterium]|nr:VOC family protein [Caulobacteraceae bacterium]